MRRRTSESISGRVTLAHRGGGQLGMYVVRLAVAVVVIRRSQRGPAADAEFLEDAREVHLDGRLTDLEPRGKLLVRNTSRRVPQHLALASAQTCVGDVARRKPAFGVTNGVANAIVQPPAAGPDAAPVRDTDGADDVFDRCC